MIKGLNKISSDINFNFSEFTLAYGIDDLLYATSKATGEVFVHMGEGEWMDYEKFISLDISSIDSMHD